MTDAGAHAPYGTATSVAAAKARLRARLLARRAARPVAQRAAAARLLATSALDIAEVADAETVAAYVGFGTEPGTDTLLAALREAGRRVLLPVLRADGDLDWAAYDGPAALVQGPGGLRQPAGVRLGPAAVAQAQAVLVPGLAVDVTGVRLGRGGGSYDRALARVPAGRFTAVLVYDDEVLPAVPAQAHDRPVGAALTPSGLRPLGGQ